jgi:hypothetical protein
LVTSSVLRRADLYSSSSFIISEKFRNSIFTIISRSPFHSSSISVHYITILIMYVVLLEYMVFLFHDSSYSLLLTTSSFSFSFMFMYHTDRLPVTLR